MASRLADRIMENPSINNREKKDRILDNMDIERERGITIKAQSVRLKYDAKDGNTYYLNIIDTPAAWILLMRLAARALVTEHC